MRIRSLLASLVLAGDAHAARPLVTDDARVVERGACQLETWAKLSAAGNEWRALPACNPTGRLEVAAGAGMLPEERRGPPAHPVAVVQGKYLVRSLTQGLPAVAVVLGGVPDANRPPPWSASPR